MADILADLYQSGFSGLSNADIAAFTGKTLTSSEQTLADSLIKSCELYFARQCHRNFKDLGSDSYFEILDAGDDEYHFFNFPVKEVTKITLDSQTVYDKIAGSNTYTLNLDFFVYPEKIVFERVTPMSSINNRRALKIYYSIENIVSEDLKLAIKQWASDLLLNREYAGKTVNSLNVPGLSLNFDANSIPSYVQQVISNYRKVLI